MLNFFSKCKFELKQSKLLKAPFSCKRRTYSLNDTYCLIHSRKEKSQIDFNRIFSQQDHNYLGLNIISSEIEEITVYNKSFESSSFSGTSLEEGQFTDCTFLDHSFCQTEFVGINFVECSFDSTSFANARFVNCIFTKCKFNYSIFSSSTIKDTTFNQSKFMKSFFSSAILFQSSFLDSMFDETYVYDCELSMVSSKNLSGSVITSSPDTEVKSFMEAYKYFEHSTKL